MRTESKTHRKIIEEVINSVGGINTDDKTRVLGSYHPDVQLKDIDIEVEVFNNLKHVRNKWRRWDKKRKKILIIAIPNEVKEVFDKIYLWDSD